MDMDTARGICFTFVVISQLVSGLIMPMTDLGGKPDVTSIISHITLMESSISKLETEAMTSHDQLIVVNERLKSTSEELASVKTELKTTQGRLRSAEAEILTLQNDKKLRPTALELNNIKSDVSALNSFRIQQMKINLTLIDEMGKDIKRNYRNLLSLKSTVEGNTVDINNTRIDGEVHGLQQRKFQEEVTRVNAEINNATVVANIMMADIRKLKTGQDDLRVGGNATRQDVATLQSLTSTTHLELHKAMVDIRSLEVFVKANLSTAVSDFSTQLANLHHNLEKQIDQVSTDVAFQVRQIGDRKNWTTLHFDTVELNQGAGYDSKSGYFTAPIDGTYLFWCNILMYHSSGYVNIYKGSTILVEGFTYAADNDSVMTVVTQLNKGDQVHFTAGSTKIVTDGGESHYGGALLHARRLPV